MYCYIYQEDIRNMNFLNILFRGNVYMLFIKYVFLVFIFIGCTSIGYILSKKFRNRVSELKEFKSAINIMKNKIKFTYKPLQEIFGEISKIAKNGISDLFKQASLNVKGMNAKDAWNIAIEDSKNYLDFNKEDLNIIKSIGNMLGKTDINGQVSELDLSMGLIDLQIDKAEEYCKKNERMYKSLGSIVGLAVIIILM